MLRKRGIQTQIVFIIVRKVQRTGRLCIKPPRATLEQHIIILGNNSHLNNVIHQINASHHPRFTA